MMLTITAKLLPDKLDSAIFLSILQVHAHQI